ncbi:hypothetical protein [Deinococcus cellulosilyticus]|uniref:Uncharacterized protein n=1 Tax=Deinococcus cellulosilyticus (strain DSM 18568 / NBRC 106333 / KACC 11606 / 5516J-15) TaxID=1223518 RepID=A0A511N927_DEIC1|nr:hypothetical protein [Deinococcus cellulosilyticus]GEM49344.1 hypothetical protein DC3_49790 [Deinococcus cellulosilyticus NBRC 106333 = KACC 11606]
MENIYSSPRFTNHPREGSPESCGVQVFSDPQRHQVTVVFHVRNHRTLRTEPHRLVNAFYREVLFRLLSPASVIRWYCCQDGFTHQTIHLAGLPGGYTSGQVAYSLSLAAPGRARVATG